MSIDPQTNYTGNIEFFMFITEQYYNALQI